MSITRHTAVQKAFVFIQCMYVHTVTHVKVWVPNSMRHDLPVGVRHRK